MDTDWSQERSWQGKKRSSAEQMKNYVTVRSLRKVSPHSVRWKIIDQCIFCLRKKEIIRIKRRKEYRKKDKEWNKCFNLARLVSNFIYTIPMKPCRGVSLVRITVRGRSEISAVYTKFALQPRWNCVLELGHVKCLPQSVFPVDKLAASSLNTAIWFWSSGRPPHPPSHR